ncbi:MAG: hypothetical protein JW829_20295 [Pirellulales bacterium]|nr:hypothetical protein [Pirellulales bacterium]
MSRGKTCRLGRVLTGIARLAWLANLANRAHPPPRPPSVHLHLVLALRAAERVGLVHPIDEHRPRLAAAASPRSL